MLLILTKLLHFFALIGCIEDLGFFDYPGEDRIGYSIYDRQEEMAIQELVQTLNQLLENVGPNQPDDVYLNSPYWDAVIETAGKAYELFHKNDELYGEKQ